MRDWGWFCGIGLALYYSTPMFRSDSELWISQKLVDESWSYQSLVSHTMIIGWTDTSSFSGAVTLYFDGFSAIILSETTIKLIIVGSTCVNQWTRWDTQTSIICLPSIQRLASCCPRSLVFRFWWVKCLSCSFLDLWCTQWFTRIWSFWVCTIPKSGRSTELWFLIKVIV